MAKRDNKNIGLEKFCLTIIRWGTYLILFAPLIVYRDSFFPFVTPKTIYFRVLVEIIFAAFLVLALLSSRYRPKLNAVTVVVAIFVVVLIITSITGINFSRSFWSTYERMTGLLTFFHLLAFLIILVSVFKTKEDWQKILTVSVLVGVLLSLYVVSGNQMSTRGGGTIGNTSFMAAYLLFDIFFALILFLENKSFGVKLFYGACLGLMLLILLSSTARGATISFFGGIFLFVISYLIFSDKKKLKVIGASLILISIILVAIAALYQPKFIKDRIDLTLRQMQPRFVVWEKAWKGFLEKPVLGWGPENFNVVFTKYFNSCMFIGECGEEIWFDRAHNIILDTLVTTGIIGFVSYISIFLVCLFVLFKVLMTDQENKTAAVLMISLLAVYLVQNILVFDMISSYTVFFLSLGFVGFLSQQSKNIFESSQQKQDKYGLLDQLLANKYIRAFVFAIIIVPTILIMYFGNINPVQSASKLVSLIVGSVSLEESIELYKGSINTFMEKYEIREQFSQKVYGAGFKQQDSPETLREAFDLAESEIEKSMQENTIDFRPHLFAGRLYFSDYRFSQDIKKLDRAEDIFKKAMQLSPTNQQAYWHLAEVSTFRGDIQTAVDYFQKAIDLEPRLGRSHWFLAITYGTSAFDYDKFIEELDRAEANEYNYKRDLEDVRRVGQIYNSRQDDVRLLDLYEGALEYNPENAELWANLAAAYANLGDLENAKKAAEKVKELDPSQASRVEEFLNEL